VSVCGKVFDLHDVVVEATGREPSVPLRGRTGTCALPPEHEGACVVLAARWMFERSRSAMRWSAACSATSCGRPAEVSFAFCEAHPGVELVIEGGEHDRAIAVVRIPTAKMLELMFGLSLWPRDVLESMAREEAKK
jgi:hypothetical protein